MMIDASSDHAVELKDAFSAFALVAEKLRAAYEGLQRTAANLDRDLADANARLKAQVEELENLSGSLAAVLRAIPCGVVVAGCDGTILMANPAAEGILERKGTELIGSAAAGLRDAAGRPLLLLADGPAEVQERVIENGCGVRVIDDRVVPVCDAAGNHLGLVEVLNDRSEVKALELEVKRLDRLAELGRVAAIIAHEMRNPLSGIRGFAGMLERHLQGVAGAETPRRWARRICEGVERTDAIIDSVLFLARPRPLARASIDAERFLCDAFECVAQAAPSLARGIHVSIAVHPPGLCVPGDETRLRQALTNLIQNALEALGGAGRLELAARQRARVVELEVRDSGPGVPAEARARLYEPFFTTKTEGAGLGLALVRRIAELHGGSVEMRPGIGSGAAFVLAVPAEALPAEACCS
ncbi:MAG: PAS domain-containing protein [Planctomycetes bacterium]|nr:PAS domain-containing protein [Planctomycetota bacterium]